MSSAEHADDTTGRSVRAGGSRYPRAVPKGRAIVAACALLLTGCSSEVGSDLLAGADRNVTLGPAAPSTESSIEVPPEPLPSESAPPTSADSSADATAALAAWQTYQAAVLDRNGAAAAVALSGGTLDYYAGLLDSALYATAAELDRLPVVDVTTILIARFRYPADELQALDGRGFATRIIRDGLIDESTAEGVRFDQAEVAGGTARLRTTAVDQRLQTLEMRREADGWKVHLVAALRELGQPLENFALTEGLSPTAASLELIRRSAPQASASVLEPLRPR